MMNYLTEPEQRELLKAARTQLDPLAQRDYHWMAVLIITGMRVHEFSMLVLGRVRLALVTGWLISDKQHCKGKRKANEYVVTAQLRLHLMALVRAAGELDQLMGDEHPLVCGRVVDNVIQPLSVRSYEARLKHWGTAAGLDPRISPHWLRHTRGMNVMRRSKGNNALKVAQIALNHASLRSTGVYLHVNREEFMREMELVDGAGRVTKAQARMLSAGVGA